MVVRVFEAQYDDGVLRPTERLGLSPGEQVSLILLRRADSSRWDLERFAKIAHDEDAALASQGLGEWADELDAAENA